MMAVLVVCVKSKAYMSNLTNFKIYEKYSGEPRMFFGEGRGIQEFVDLAYPEFLKLKDQQQDQDWPHNEFILTQDAKDLANMNQASRHIFTSNFQSQIFADTVQGRGPAWLVPYCSDPALEGLLIEWARSECLHSRSYTHILTSIYPNPRIVLDMIEQKPEIFRRFSQATEAYDTFFANPSKENLVVLMAAINILESLAFVGSFACNFAFAKSGIVESVAKFLALIFRDEKLHIAITQRIIKNWSSGKDGKEWKEIWHDNKSKITDMYHTGLAEEFEWNKYLFQYGSPLTSLNEQLLNDWDEYNANQSMKRIGLKTTSKITKNPLPWVKIQYENQKMNSFAPQETKTTSYLKNPIIKIEDLSALSGLKLL